MKIPKQDANKKEMNKFIKINGLIKIRTKGSHKIYKTRDNKTISLTIPMNRIVLQDICKKKNLKMLEAERKGKQ